MSDINSMFTDLFEKYYDPLMHYCTAKKIRRYDSEDIVSEAYERALSKSWQLSFLNENQQKTWLYTAVSLIIKEKAAKKGILVFASPKETKEYAHIALSCCEVPTTDFHDAAILLHDIAFCN